MDLLVDLGFIVLEGAVTSREVASALPLSAVSEGVGPRRGALAETLHVGDEQGYNRHRFAVFGHAGKTVIAKPGGFVCTGDMALEAALSRRFGETHTFHSHFAMAGVLRFRGGLLDAQVDEFTAAPPGGLVGLTRPLRADEAGAVMRTVLARHLGAPWEEIFPRRGATAGFWRFA